MSRPGEPEREIVRRLAPFGIPAAAVALLVGRAVGGWDVGWSAAVGVAVVALNLVAQGVSITWAARVSLNVLAVTVMAGFVVRLAVIAAVLVWLRNYDWFSVLVFALTVVPATLALLAYEMRLIARGLGGALILDPTEGRAVR